MKYAVFAILLAGCTLIDSTPIEVYFCPENDCVGIVQNELQMATSNIYFATYSFTHPRLANELLLQHDNNVDIIGIMEQRGSYSQFSTLTTNNISVVYHTAPGLMHNKFFVIDNRTVITGSFNPTRNGAQRNNENMVIIHDEKIAKLYSEEFIKIYNSQVS